MATNFVQPGDVIELAAPTGGVVTGVPELIGGLFVVPLVTAAVGVRVSCQVTGVFTLAKTSAQAWTEGQKIYWDDDNSRCDSDSTLGQLIGVAALVAANPSATGVVRLNGTAPATAEGPQGAIVALNPRRTVIAKPRMARQLEQQKKIVGDDFAGQVWLVTRSTDQMAARIGDNWVPKGKMSRDQARGLRDEKDRPLNFRPVDLRKEWAPRSHAALVEMARQFVGGSGRKGFQNGSDAVPF